MAATMFSREELENRIITGNRNGESIRSLARNMGISRNTVRGILRNFWRTRGERSSGPGEKVSIPRKKKLDPFVGQIRDLLERYPKLSAVRVYEEIKNRGYEGGLTQLQAKVRELRPRPKQEPVIRFEVEPGEQGQMDWSFYNVDFTRTGRTKLCCFGYVLKYSRKLYVDFCERRDYYNMIRRHREAFEYFGGVPRECLYDGEKTVLLRWEAGRPVYNPAFIAFLTHYGCRPVGCRPGRPQTKGGIETMFKMVEGHLLAGRRFVDLNDLRKFTRQWLVEKSDPRRVGQTGKTVAELFSEEREALLELPVLPYDTCEVVMRVGDREGFVRLGTNRYSIPFSHVGEILTLKADEHRVTIYDAYVRVIAHHRRLPRAAAGTMRDPHHHTDGASRYGVQSIREVFGSLGAYAEAFLKGLISRHPRSAGAKAREILTLKQSYFAHDIDSAMAHAITYSAFDPAAIAKILKARAQPRDLESFLTENARTRTSDQIPVFRQRDLSDYDCMVGTPSEEKQS